MQRGDGGGGVQEEIEAAGLVEKWLARKVCIGFALVLIRKNMDL